MVFTVSQVKIMVTFVLLFLFIVFIFGLFVFCQMLSPLLHQAMILKRLCTKYSENNCENMHAFHSFMMACFYGLEFCFLSVLCVIFIFSFVLLDCVRCLSALESFD